MSRSFKCLLSLRFPYQNPLHLLLVPVCSTLCKTAVYLKLNMIHVRRILSDTLQVYSHACCTVLRIHKKSDIVCCHIHPSHFTKVHFILTLFKKEMEHISQVSIKQHEQMTCQYSTELSWANSCVR